MKFYKRNEQSTPPSPAKFPCAVLNAESWDDFSYETTYRVKIYRHRDREVFSGTLKIAKKDPDNPRTCLKKTPLPKEFETLDDDYCSLGQELRYYEKLKHLGARIYEPFLKALRDAVYSKDVAQTFEVIEAFNISLLRFSEAEKAFREGPALFGQSQGDTSFVFSFKCQLPNATKPHEVDFDFTPDRSGLNRTMVIIGKNGTGKTQFLAHLARAISGWTSEDERPSFHPSRPSFSRVIAVSYSIFDDFERPPDDLETFSYKYCGIRAPESSQTPQTIAEKRANESLQPARFLSPTELRDRLEKARSSLVRQSRQGQWKRILKIMLEQNDDEESDGTLRNPLALYDRLSSGQRILMAVLTEIISVIRKDSLVLFDEPELHLHPELLFGFARAFHQLLDEFDSFALFATHSPLLLQEIPSRQVRLFKRIGNVPVILPLTTESFGENLTTITREVFAVDGDHHNFRDYLKRLSETKSYEEILGMFPNGMPVQAKAYLKSIKKDEQR